MVTRARRALVVVGNAMTLRPGSIDMQHSGCGMRRAFASAAVHVSSIVCLQFTTRGIKTDPLQRLALVNSIFMIFLGS